MPYLDIATNAPLPDAAKRGELIGGITKIASKRLGKAESFFMVRLTPEAFLQLGGSDAPCCVIDLRLIGEPAADVARALCEELTSFVALELAAPAERVFLVLTDVPRRLWGVGGRLLG